MPTIGRIDIPNDIFDLFVKEGALLFAEEELGYGTDSFICPALQTALDSIQEELKQHPYLADYQNALVRVQTKNTSQHHHALDMSDDFMKIHRETNRLGEELVLKLIHSTELSSADSLLLEIAQRKDANPLNPLR